jgi:hypothetical protein
VQHAAVAVLAGNLIAAVDRRSSALYFMRVTCSQWEHSSPTAGSMPMYSMTARLLVAVLTAKRSTPNSSEISAISQWQYAAP